MRREEIGSLFESGRYAHEENILPEEGVFYKTPELVENVSGDSKEPEEEIGIGYSEDHRIKGIHSGGQ